MNNKNNTTFMKNMFPYLILLGVVIVTFLVLDYKGNKVNELSSKKDGKLCLMDFIV